MTMWADMAAFAAQYLDDRGSFETETRQRAQDAGVNWRSFEASVKAEAKKLKKQRLEAEREQKREQDRAERQARQEAAAAHGAMHMRAAGHGEVAQVLCDHLATKHKAAPAYDEGSVYCYDDSSGTWCPMSDDYLMGLISSWDGVATVGAECKPYICNNVKTPLEIAKSKMEFQKRGHGFFRDHGVGIAFADCFVTIVNGQVDTRRNGPDNRCRFGFPFSIGSAKLAGSRFEAMLVSMFGSTKDSRAELIGELVGLCALGLMPKWNKCVVFFGEGGSGKGTLLRVIQACFPRDKVGSIQPQQWSNGASLDLLAGIRLNAVNEMNTDDLADVGRFKAVVSGDLIEANPKYKKPYSFSPSAGHFFTVNPGQLPTVPDADEPFWQRWVIVPFEKVFRGTQNEDRNIADEIIADEMHVVIAWALSCAARAIELNRLTKCAAGDAVLQEWREGVNPVANFLAERTAEWVGDARNAPTLGELFVEYQKWCLEAGHKPSSRTVLGRRLRALGLVERSNGTRIKVRLLKPHEYDAANDPLWDD